MTAIETLGDLTACSELSGQPTSGPVYWRRIRGGVFADGVNCALAAVLNCFPEHDLRAEQWRDSDDRRGQPPGRFRVRGLLLVIVFGVLPGLGRWLASVPPPVIGGLTLVLFGMIAAAGIRILTRAGLGQREVLIIAIALGLGLGVDLHPEALAPLPDSLKLIFSSGISTGGLAALLLNVILPRPPVVAAVLPTIDWSAGSPSRPAGSQGVDLSGAGGVLSNQACPRPDRRTLHRLQSVPVRRSTRLSTCRAQQSSKASTGFSHVRWKTRPRQGKLPSPRIGPFPVSPGRVGAKCPPRRSCRARAHPAPTCFPRRCAPGRA